jgi:coenzyme F420-dependent glucose-6-phosphate dehydrogenase
MVNVSIMASHEQFSPTDLLDDVITMEKYGLKKCWTSDHFMPWWDTGAKSGATWPWLGAALAKTEKITIGTSVTAPILRYNPAVVAQVFATLGYMFPNRTFLTVGTGESVNEVPSGHEWPSNAERFERLKEALTIIKRLWNEDWVYHYQGKYYWLKDAKLYLKPQTPIPMYVAAMGPQTAEFAGQEADGLVTNEVNPKNLKEKVLPSFQQGAQKSGKDYESMLKAVFMPASFDEDKQKALQSIEFWKGAMIKAMYEVDIHDPREIQENGQVVGNDVMEKMAFVISSAEEGIKKISTYAEIGLTDIVLINSSPDKESLVKLLAQEIIPAIINNDTTKSNTNQLTA